MNKSHNHGFTLIELMIVVAIVAILAAIAYPSYQEQVRKSRRADCAGALTGLASAMERYFTANSTYAGATLGTGAATDIYGDQCPVDGGTATYNLTVESATQTAFEIRATPTGPQTGDRCGTLTLTQTGQKGILGADAGLTVQDCW